ncbi:hypothetical protein TNCV_3384801 [Trichonephila clavipes]|uniref:Uncharacterized protein n=1 Tax=Trichonephila clavipes TaxID=2585209 RepID=A0A8X6SQB5_TRICX|nr:hypothetical protein TNCV_3384801 [Trichonephila clavipes]
MDTCKIFVLLDHGGTVKNQRSTCPLVRLVKEEDNWETLYHFQDVVLQNWGRGIEPNRIAPHVLRATANDRFTRSLLPRGLQSVTII